MRRTSHGTAPRCCSWGRADPFAVNAPAGSTGVPAQAREGGVYQGQTGLVGNGRGSEAGIAGAVRDELGAREWSPMLLEPVVAAALPSGGGRVRRFRDRDELIKAVEEVTSEECGVGLILDAILEAVQEEFDGRSASL